MREVALNGPFRRCHEAKFMPTLHSCRRYETALPPSVRKASEAVKKLRSINPTPLKKQKFAGVPDQFQFFHSFSGFPQLLFKV